MMSNRRPFAAAEANYDLLVKLLLLGDSAVGKSSLLLRFCEQRFDNNFVLTIGVDFKTKVVESGGKKLKLQVWDTAGQERFRTITPAYFRSAMGVVLAYDVTNAETFTNLRRWLRNVDDYADTNVKKLLIGNKCDLESKREVPHQRGVDLAAEYGIPFFEASAKQNINVEEAFMHIADQVRIARFPSSEVGEDSGSRSTGSTLTGSSVALTPDSLREPTPHRKCCSGMSLPFSSSSSSSGASSSSEQHKSHITKP